MRTINLSQGRHTWVDDHIAHRLLDMNVKVFTRSNGYACFNNPEANGDAIYLSRWILGLRKGDRLVGDHINGDRLDNRLSNLRHATSSENARNKGPLRPDYTGFHGVFRRFVSRDFWVKARVPSGSRKLHEVYLGDYRTRAEAAKVYDAVARFYGHLPLNFPDILVMPLSVKDARSAWVRKYDFAEPRLAVAA
jgi:hypothetical protein